MAESNQDKIKEVLSRGVEEIIVAQDLEKQLRSEKRLRVYFGIDPTGAKLHLGHAVILWKLREFQELGHEVILLVGDFTAQIGDPTDRDAMRVPLTPKQIAENMKNYKQQASKILDFRKLKVRYNSKWLSKLNFAKILELSSHFTVQQMLHRDMFDRRMKEDAPISLSEFMYPLMQGYDSVAMDVDLEIGGNDQLFNMLAGRTLQKIYHNKDKSVLTVKLLMGTDGRKMSKTYNNAIYFSDSAKEMFGKLMSIKDELIDSYAEICLPFREDIKREWMSYPNPRDKKAGLAKSIVALYCGYKEAEKAEQEFNNVFKDGGVPSDIKEFQTPKRTYLALDLLVDAGLTDSKSEAKRMIEGGGVELEYKTSKFKIQDWKGEVNIEDGMIIRYGKRGFIKVKN